MLISLRSHLIAGTVAAVSAGAVAVAPVAASGHLLPASGLTSSQVALTALSNPFEQLIATFEVAQNYVFGNYYNGSDFPTPGAGEANWTAAGFDQTGGDLLNFLLYNQIPLGLYRTVGLLPQGAINAGPVFQQLQLNLFEYINIGLRGLTGALTGIANGVWNFPGAVVTAAELALQGQITEALSVLGNAIISPILTVTDNLLGASIAIATSFIAKTVAVVTALPQVATTFAGTGVGSAVYLTEKTLSIATSWLTSLASLDFEGAWNIAVNGLLGPTGLPGAVLNLTTGAGVQTGPIINPETDIVGNFVPSVRTSYQAGLWTIAEALAVEPFQAATSAAAVRADAEAAPAAPVEKLPADTAEATVSADASADPAAAVAEHSAADPAPAAASGADTGSAKAGTTQSRSKRAAAR